MRAVEPPARSAPIAGSMADSSAAGVRGGLGTWATRKPSPSRVWRRVCESRVLPEPISPVITTSPPSCVMPNRSRARPSRWSARSYAKRGSGSSRNGPSARPKCVR